MTPKINLIVAVCENMGIGVNGGLPWKLKSELAYFSRMTKETRLKSKKNMVVMGRRTWESIPERFRPLAERVNVILSSQMSKNDVRENVLIYPTFEAAMEEVKKAPFAEQIETVWVIGGSSVYRLALASEFCHRIYLTKIHKIYDCDTFLPPIDGKVFKRVEDSVVPEGLQEENSTTFEYIVYEKINQQI